MTVEKSRAGERSNPAVPCHSVLEKRRGEAEEGGG